MTNVATPIKQTKELSHESRNDEKNETEKTMKPIEQFTLVILCAAFSSLAMAQTRDYKLDRTVLPIPEPQPPTITELDARNAKAPPRFEVKAAKGSPNVVVVLLDDIGFGQSSAFGGPCKMETAEKLAAAGLRYNDFHTTALCSPTRTALLTGRNHH